MIYLSINKNKINLLYLKKTIFSQQETYFFQKKHEVDLLKNNAITSDDLLASAIKEAVTLTKAGGIAEKDVFLILPQEMFYFLRADVPNDIAPPAVVSFIKDKARAAFPVDIDQCIGDFFITESAGQKTVAFYAVLNEMLERWQKILSLLDLRIINLLPDTLAYFKLFEKTLRKEKKENIFYVKYEKDHLNGYLFDTFGLILPNQSHAKIEENNIEKVLKDQVSILEKDRSKINRIVLSGEESDKIRQDTFTKSVGIWTNPLKRIVANFYESYLKMLILTKKEAFPILSFDNCLGAFIFAQENKNFSFLKNNLRKLNHNKKVSLPKIALPLKEIVIFIVSFGLSFYFFSFMSKNKMSFDFLSKMNSKTITATPSPKAPTPTPTLSVKKETIRISVVNGGGVKGKGAELWDILKNRGYQEVLKPKNADNFDYEVTEINVKDEKKEIANLIAGDLKDYVSKPKIGKIGSEEAADVIIIIGKDFK